MEPIERPTSQASPTQASTSPRSAARRWLTLLVRIAGVVLIGVILVLASLQTQLIFPGATTQGTPEAQVTPGPGCEILRLTTSAGEKVVALYGPALDRNGKPLEDAESRPTLLYFYGNAMCIRSAAEEFEAFRRLGVNVLIAEYLGYGMSEGSPSELGCRATAEAAYDYLRNVRRVDPRRIVAAGWSLGGAVAIDLAYRQPLGGLIVFCTFTRVADMVHRLFPFIPTTLFLNHKFDSLSKIAKISCPILIGHGKRDQIIPFEMSERLANAATSPVTRFAIDEADHNDFFLLGARKILGAMGPFLAEIPPRP